MNRAELEHAIRAACDVADDTELYIFGSQAILGSYPYAPDELKVSMEADICPKNKRENVDKIDGALGELSSFHQLHGFYVQGVDIHDTATLPAGWEERCKAVRNENTRYNTGYCLEAHDLAISKLVAFRAKDKDFVRTLIIEGFVSKETLFARLSDTVCDARIKTMIEDWITHTGD